MSKDTPSDRVRKRPIKPVVDDLLTLYSMMEPRERRRLEVAPDNRLTKNFALFARWCVCVLETKRQVDGLRELFQADAFQHFGVRFDNIDAAAILVNSVLDANPELKIIIQMACQGSDLVSEGKTKFLTWPKNWERDDKIFTLHHRAGLSYGQIQKKLRAEDGIELSYQNVAIALKRFKDFLNELTYHMERLGKENDTVYQEFMQVYGQL